MSVVPPPPPQRKIPTFHNPGPVNLTPGHQHPLHEMQVCGPDIEGCHGDQVTPQQHEEGGWKLLTTPWRNIGSLGGRNSTYPSLIGRPGHWSVLGWFLICSHPPNTKPLILFIFCVSCNIIPHFFTLLFSCDLALGPLLAPLRTTSSFLVYQTFILFPWYLFIYFVLFYLYPVHFYSLLFLIFLLFPVILHAYCVSCPFSCLNSHSIGLAGIPTVHDNGDDHADGVKLRLWDSLHILNAWAYW
jgi:hypothetical protein